MPASPTLSALVAEVDRAIDALRRHVETEPTDPATDLVSLKDAEIEFGKHEDTLRRYAVREQLGHFIGGKWYLSRAMVYKHVIIPSLCLRTMRR